MSLIDSIIAPITSTVSTVTSALTGTIPTSTGSSTSTSSSGTTSPSASSVVNSDTIAGNFETFLQLLTTQLQNQNPLDPLDTNQFTQQLVQFASVEQELKINTQLATLVSLQQTAQSTAALSFVGKTVTVDGGTAQLKNGLAQWAFTAPTSATATMTITGPTGQTVYSGTYAVQSGTQQLVWDGKDNNGIQQPDGAYTLSITAVDANGQSVAMSTQVVGTVDSVDLKQNPPLVSIGGQNYTIDQIKSVVSSGL
jgi:flagellar basal-body rod modification protein FlgD